MILKSYVAGEGPPVVLLHGLFGAAKNLGQIARRLAVQYRTVSLDLRNHGESPHAPGMDYPALAADVAESLAALGIGAARVVGHSMGGKTAMALALTRPDLVERLVVMDIAPVSYTHGYDDYVRAMQAIPLAPGLTRQAADAELAKTVAPAPLRAFLLNNLILSGRPRWRMGLAEIGAAMPELVAWRDPPGAEPYAGPALFLRGAESDYVRPKDGLEIERLFPNAALRSVAGAAHWLHADRPAEVIAELEEFLRA